MAGKIAVWKQNLVMLWISQLLIMAGFCAMAPFVPLFMKEDMNIVDEKSLMWYVAMYGLFGTLAYAIFCPIWGKLSDRFGTKPMLLRGTFVTAIFFPMMGYAPNAEWLIVLRFITAACAGTTAASQIMVARNTPENRQGFAQGVLSTAIWGGAMLGNVVGGLIIHHFNYLAAFWFCGILYFISGFAILLTHDDFTPEMKNAARLERQRRHGRQKWIPALSVPVLALISLGFVFSLIRGIDAQYVALKVADMTSLEEAAYWTGIISAVICGGAIISGALTGYLADLMPPKKMVVPLMVVSGITLLLQGFTASLWFFLAARTVLFMVAGGVAPVLQKALAEVTPRRKRGNSFGFNSLSGNMGGVCAAALGGWSAACWGVDSVFYLSAVLFIVVIPVFCRLLDVALRPCRMPVRHHHRSV